LGFFLGNYLRNISSAYTFLFYFKGVPLRLTNFKHKNCSELVCFVHKMLILFFWQVMVNSEKDRASLLCMKALANRGRLDTVSQQMASHPQYLESFLRTQHYILYMDGPLPLPYRHYIAIMVRI